MLVFGNGFVSLGGKNWAGSGSCSMDGIRVNGDVPSDYATTDLVQTLYDSGNYNHQLF